MTISRVEPDENDIVVWKLDDPGPVFANSSTSNDPANPGEGANLYLNTGAVIISQVPTMFGSTHKGVYFYGTHANPRVPLYGANFFKPQPPITISGWALFRAENPGFTEIIGKQHNVGYWQDGLYWSIAIETTNVTRQWYTGLRTESQINVTTTASSTRLYPTYTWCHLGMTYDGTTINSYINGEFESSATVAFPPQNISYGNGPWFIGALPGGGGYSQEVSASLCDWRIANIVRPASYFKEIYKIQEAGDPVPVTYYKMRAYDLTCDQAVYWVSTRVDIRDAPDPPCDGGILGPLEVLETWEVI